MSFSVVLWRNHSPLRKLIAAQYDPLRIKFGCSKTSFEGDRVQIACQRHHYMRFVCLQFWAEVARLAGRSDWLAHALDALEAWKRRVATNIACSEGKFHFICLKHCYCLGEYRQDTIATYLYLNLEHLSEMRTMKVNSLIDDGCNAHPIIFRTWLYETYAFSPILT